MFLIMFQCMKMTVDLGRIGMRSHIHLANDMTDGNNPNENEMRANVQKHADKKRLTIFHHFLGMLRSRSQKALQYWAIIVPLATWGKGGIQSAKNHTATGALCTLETLFNIQNKIHSDSREASHECIKSEQTLSVCFDNYQHSFQKSIQSFGKSSIFHQCTLFIAKMNATPDISNGTLISSPLGRVYRIFSCVRINCYRVMLGGVPNMTTDVLLLPTELRSEVLRMHRCALCWPCISWDIIFTPGTDRSAELDYVSPYSPYRFQSDITKHVNPNGKQCDKFIFFPLIKHDQTSNKGMMITSMILKESLGLVEKEDNCMLSLDPNALKRQLFFYGDALSVGVFNRLYGNIHKLRTSVGKEEYVKVLLNALGRIFMTKGLFHQMMQSTMVIYDLFYGTFLQALQMHGGVKRVSMFFMLNNLQYQNTPSNKLLHQCMIRRT